MNGVIAIKLTTQFAEQRADVSSAIRDAMEAGVSLVFFQHSADVRFDLSIAETDEQIRLHVVTAQPLQDWIQKLGIKNVDVQCSRVVRWKCFQGLSRLDQGHQPGA